MIESVCECVCSNPIGIFNYLLLMLLALFTALGIYYLVELIMIKCFVLRKLLRNRRVKNE